MSSRTTAGQAELFPADSNDDRLPVVRPVVLVTRGRVEFTGRCPKCNGWHRHLRLGKVTSPCGSRYRLEPKRGRTRRAA